MPKLNFPKFDGSNSRMWIKKCNKYFALCKIVEDQKVDLACLNMIDKAEHWMSSYIVKRKNVHWSEFILDLSTRFRDEVGVNIVEKFNKISRKGSLEEYVDEFEELRSFLFLGFFH